MPFPQPTPVDLEIALQWPQSTDWLYEEKLDGVRALLVGGVLQGRNRRYAMPGPLPDFLNRYAFDGELVGNVYHVFDVLFGDVGVFTRAPLFERRTVLQRLSFPEWIKVVPFTRGDGGEFLEAVLANGGEGVVAKRIWAPYGVDWFKAKRIPTYDVVVTEIERSGSVGIAFNGRPAGRVGVYNFEAWELMRVGSVIEITCESKTKSGKFRAPRFIRIREDKPTPC